MRQSHLSGEGGKGVGINGVGGFIQFLLWINNYLRRRIETNFYKTSQLSLVIPLGFSRNKARMGGGGPIFVTRVKV